MRSISALIAAVAVLGCIACSRGSTHEPAARGSDLVVGTIADPIVLDGALVSDRESLRVVAQIFEGLTALAPGTTRVVPKLALRWTASEGGRTWTFVLRRRVRFQDGTRFDARSVCFNLGRWYRFRGSLQNPDATYYWHEIFGGFRNSDQPSLYRGCRAGGPHVVRVLLTRPFGALPAALALPSFTIASPRALRRYRADDGSVDGVGNFIARGSYAHHPTGTGPFRLGGWTPGKALVLVRNDDYWGVKARVDRLVFRPIYVPGDRVAALRSGAVDVVDLYGRSEVAQVHVPGVRVAARPPFDVGYLGINQRHEPLGRPLVRQAVAYGLDRAAAVHDGFAPRATVAREFTPPTLAGYAVGVERYPYEPARARRLLRQAGLSLPVRIDLWYPTGVRRPYLPEPEDVARSFAASLEGAGFRVDLRPSPWLPDYVRRVRSGGAGLYLLGWVGDYADAGAFLDPIFGSTAGRFGFVSRPRRFRSSVWNAVIGCAASSRRVASI